MWDISWPKSMDSGWGRKPYWSAGMALATATERPLRAAKCLAYSPAALDASGAATAGKREREIRTARVQTERDCISVASLKSVVAGLTRMSDASCGTQAQGPFAGCLTRPARIHRELAPRFL